MPIQPLSAAALHESPIVDVVTAPADSTGIVGSLESIAKGADSAELITECPGV